MSIGETLREARKKKGVSEEVAARAVRMKVDRLRAMEEGRFTDFAAPVYARSFLKQYAQYLGLDWPPLLQAFEQENPPPPRKAVFGVTDENHASTVQRHVPSPQPVSLTSTGQTVLISTLLVLAVLGFCIWWIWRNPLPISEPSYKAPPKSVPAVPANPPPAESSAEGWQPLPSPDLLPSSALTLGTNSNAAGDLRLP